MSKANETRLLILQKAFSIIYMNGYQATSIDEIIDSTRVTKGAFYYHFKNKEDMGLAVINEVMYPIMYESFVKPLQNSISPAEDIYNMVAYLLMDDAFLQVKYGCPAANLTQEMSPINHHFSEALSLLTHQWEEAIIKCINHGKKTGLIQATTKGKQVAYFVMSGYWGIRNFGKLQNSNAPYKVFLKELKQYLSTL